MLVKFREFFKHYSKVDLVNWLSIVLAMFLGSTTAKTDFYNLFAWLLLVLSFFWLFFLHYEIDATLVSWKQKQKEFPILVKFSKKAEMTLWTLWSGLLFIDWLGMFYATVALNKTGLGKFMFAPLLIISISGVVASCLYLFLNWHRQRLIIT